MLRLLRHIPTVHPYAYPYPHNIRTATTRREYSIIPPTLKKTAKALDHVAAAAALKGIEAGETIAAAAQHVIHKNSPQQQQQQQQQQHQQKQQRQQDHIASDMYGEQDLRAADTTPQYSGKGGRGESRGR